MYLPSSTLRGHTPPPSRNLLRNPAPLKLVEALIYALSRILLDFGVLDNLRAFCTGEHVVCDAVELSCDPSLETRLAGGDGVRAVRSDVLWKGGC